MIDPIVGGDPLQDPVQEVKKKEENEKKEEKVATIKPRRGHTVYEYNRKTGVLREAVFTKTDADFVKASKDNKVISNRRIDMQEDCYYFSKLNLKNAIKHLENKYKTKITL